MGNKRYWLRAIIILILAGFVFYNRTSGSHPSTYEARAMAVMSQEVQKQDVKKGEEILKDLACGRGAGIYHFQAEGDLTPNAGIEKIIGVTISKDRGLVGIFSNNQDQPVMLTYINTLPIQEVKVIRLENGHNAVLVRELLDERFGAYFLSSFYVLYTWEGHGLKEVWRKVVGNEERWNKKWFNQGKGWQGVTEKVATDFSHKDGKLLIKTISNQTLWASEDVNSSRKNVRSRTVTHTYCWNPAWGAMVMAEGRVSKNTSLKIRQGNKYIDKQKLKAGEKVAILEEEDLLSWLKPGEPAYWRVKTKNGQVGYILKSEIDYLP
ncbi:MAG: hypothetical protein PWP31_1282 [Clostridia bacterium]|nr:hypothetical protein [Clostridia bacterium]